MVYCTILHTLTAVIIKDYKPLTVINQISSRLIFKNHKMNTLACLSYFHKKLKK